MEDKPSVRPITHELLDEFTEWTRTAPMFTGSPQGKSFAEELRDIFTWARIGLDANGYHFEGLGRTR